MRKINIGGATGNGAAKKKTEHATVEVGERLESLIREFIVVAPQAKRLESQRKALSGDIGSEARPLFFERFAGVVPDSSTMLAQVDGMTVKLIVKEKYAEGFTDDEALAGAIGRANVEKYFHWRTKYGIDYDKIPEDKQEAFAQGVEELRAKLGVPSEAITAKQYLEPNAGFHAARTTLLSVEQNKALDALIPVVAYPLI